MKKPILTLDDICKSFNQGFNNIDILLNLSCKFYEGEMIALVGPSGSGKSTLLQIAGLLDAPKSGKIFFSDNCVNNVESSKKTLFRRNYVGFVYQFHNLLPDFTALENVAIPQMISGISKKTAFKKSKKLLQQLNLNDRYNHKPGQLSGGEQQRCAIARALSNEPKLLLADEPTGNLDVLTANKVFELLYSVAKEKGLTSVVVTHNYDLASKMDKVLELKNGKLVQVN